MDAGCLVFFVFHDEKASSRIRLFTVTSPFKTHQLVRSDYLHIYGQPSSSRSSARNTNRPQSDDILLRHAREVG